jgi:hypothetical protein
MNHATPRDHTVRIEVAAAASEEADVGDAGARVIAVVVGSALPGATGEEEVPHPLTFKILPVEFLVPGITL